MAGDALTEAVPAPARAMSRVARAGLVAPVAILAIGVLAFGLARAALLPDVGLWDTAEYQTVPPLLGTLHPTGFPAYVVLGWVASALLAPLGTPAFRMDLLSALLLGAAVAGTGWLTLALTGRLSLAVIAGLGLAVTPVAWRIGTRADAHALQLAILPYLLLALVEWERRCSAEAVAAIEGTGGAEGRADPRIADRLLLVTSGLLGLALANHRLIALLVPGIAAFVLVVEPRILRRRRFAAACVGLALGVAVLLYLELPLRAGPFRAPIVYGHPDTFIGFWYVVLGVQFGGALLSSMADPLRELASLAALAVEQLGVLAAALPAAVVVVCACRPRYALLSVPAALLICLFAAGYADADIGRYYLGPALFAWTWLAIAASWLLDLLAAERGWGRLAAMAGRAAVPGLPPETMAAEPMRSPTPPETPSTGTGSAAALIPPRARTDRDVRRRGLLATTLMVGALVAAVVPTLPGRWTAALADARQASGRAWLDAALATMRQDSLVVSWWSYSTPLWYAQLIEGRRRDVRVVDDRTRLDEGLGDIFSVIDSNLGHRTIYAIRVDSVEIARMVRRYDTTFLPLPDGPGLVRIDGIRDPAA